MEIQNMHTCELADGKRFNFDKPLSVDIFLFWLLFSRAVMCSFPGIITGQAQGCYSRAGCSCRCALNLQRPEGQTLLCITSKDHGACWDRSCSLSWQHHNSALNGHCTVFPCLLSLRLDNKKLIRTALCSDGFGQEPEEAVIIAAATQL